MPLKYVGRIITSLFIGLTCWLASDVRGDDDKPNITRKQSDGWQIEFFQNSVTMSQALDISASGAIIGVKETQPNLRQVHFYYDNDGFKDMPMPKGFTSVEAVAMSDTKLVIGHAMKAIGSEGSLRAVVWSPDKDELKLLPTPEGDVIADATDITPDGKRITGYATGPLRLRPVVWEWNEAQADWQVEVLPTEHQDNPYLMSSHLVISPDGNTIIGCCTDKFLPNGVIDSSLYQWRKADGKWTQSRMSEEQLYVKAVNNRGQIVGSILNEQGRQPCLVTLDGTIKILDLLEGDVSGEARDINQDSTIVGWSDDPHGPDGGPMPCTWNVQGQVTHLKVNDPGYGMLYAINDKGQIAGAADDEQSALLAVRITK